MSGGAIDRGPEERGSTRAIRIAIPYPASVPRATAAMS